MSLLSSLFGTSALKRVRLVTTASLSLNFANSNYTTATAYSRTNYAWNSAMNGAGVSALPTGWSASAFNGLSYNVVGSGVENNLPYVDIRWAGTAGTSGSNAFVFFGPSNGNPNAPAANGQTWTSSVYTRVVGGSTSGLSSSQLGFRQFNGSTFLSDVMAGISLPTTFSRVWTTGTTNNASVTGVSGEFSMNTNNGGVVDITIRFYAPQLEQTSYPTSVILTSGSGGTTVSNTNSTNLADVGALTFTNSTGGYGQKGDGTLVLFPPNTPRITDLGLLVEESRTNLNTNTNVNPPDLTNVTLTNAPNGLATLTVVDDSAALAAIGLSGRVYKLDNSLGNGQAQASPQGSNSVIAAHVISAYARGTGQLALSVAGEGNANFNTAGYARVQALANPTVTGRRLTMRANAGQVLYFVLNQMELGDFATSPIPVAGAAATRAADVVKYDGLSIPASPVTLVASGVALVGQNNASGTQLLASLNDGTNYYGSVIDNATGKGGVNGTGITSTTIGGNAVSTGQLLTVASQLTSGASRMSINNSAVVANIGTAAEGTSTTLVIGDRLSADKPWNSYIKYVRVYPYAATDPQLQSLSLGNDILQLPSSGPAVWSTSDKTAGVSLSNSNKTAQTTTTNSEGVRASSPKSSGKWYFEVTADTVGTPSAPSTSAGVADSSCSLTSVPGSVDAHGISYSSDGLIRFNSQGNVMPTFGSTQSLQFAVDLDNKRFWARKGSAGNWNNNASYNPATNTGGIDISLMGSPVYIIYEIGAAGSQNEKASIVPSASYTGAIPSGFSAWT